MNHQRKLRKHLLLSLNTLHICREQFHPTVNLRVTTADLRDRTDYVGYLSDLVLAGISQSLLKMYNDNTCFGSQ